MGKLRDVSNGMTAAVAVAAGSVVAVRSRRRPASGIVWADDLVVTASHVIRRDEGIVVVLPDGGERAAVLVGRDPATDLALLRVADGGLTPATWADPDTVGVGALVLPLARVRGRVRAALGLVADVADAWQTALGGTIDHWIDVDGTLPDGGSGGPLVNADGEVVGLNTSALTRRGAVVPRATVARVAQHLLDHGTTAPGYLGVGFYPGTLSEDVATTAGQSEALMAVSLEPDGPGALGGIQVGDALVRIDAQPVTGLRHLVGLLGAKGAGADVVLSVVRAGSVEDVPVTLGERPARKRSGWCR